MSAIKKIALATVVYVGYQLLNNKKYENLRKDVYARYKDLEPIINENLDSVHNYLSVPKNVSDETVRIRIDEEINLIKEKIRLIDAKKVAENTNRVISTIIEKTSSSLTELKKRK
jgi:hypothetical protein